MDFFSHFRYLIKKKKKLMFKEDLKNRSLVKDRKL